MIEPIHLFTGVDAQNRLKPALSIEEYTPFYSVGVRGLLLTLRMRGCICSVQFANSQVSRAML